MNIYVKVLFLFKVLFNILYIMALYKIIIITPLSINRLTKSLGLLIAALTKYSLLTKLAAPRRL